LGGEVQVRSYKGQLHHCTFTWEDYTFTWQDYALTWEDYAITRGCYAFTRGGLLNHMGELLVD
jgi:hypothetical protein